MGKPSAAEQVQTNKSERRIRRHHDDQREKPKWTSTTD